ncbi:MAG: ribosome small subunit-dependent GTPase A [Steroidobacteraceae bacterium]|jgi:ribosome biogenesis GTPase|nr:ribosome small subunit-dependent GTPase A [Steroidobacteraceae bacterium]
MNASSGEPARVVESFGRRVIVETAQGERLPAELFGKRLNSVCGDHVRIRRSTNAGDVARVIAVEPRRTLFARTDSRGRLEPLAANVSLIAAIIAPRPEPDPYIVDRYLAGAALAGVDAALIVNKSELAQAREERFLELIREYESAGYPVVFVSALHDADVADVAALIGSRTAVLAGQSGVGKSTLTNRLVPQSARATRELSGATGEGRHTTVSTALFRLPSTGELIDSPGVRDYAPPPVADSQVQKGWPEIWSRASSCRFNDCLHLREPGCAVTAAVQERVIAPRRYESYKRLLNIMRGLAPEYERRR